MDQILYDQLERQNRTLKKAALTLAAAEIQTAARARGVYPSDEEAARQAISLWVAVEKEAKL